MLFMRMCADSASAADVAQRGAASQLAKSAAFTFSQPSPVVVVVDGHERDLSHFARARRRGRRSLAVESNVAFGVQSCRRLVRQTRIAEAAIAAAAAAALA